MPQAILTKYLGPTDTRGGRIKASCERGSITIPYPHKLSGDAVHRLAVQELVTRFCEEDWSQYGTPFGKNPWARDYVTGGLPSGDCAHVFID